MWILPSRSRLLNVARLALTFVQTKAMTPVLLCVDDDDPLLPAYRAMALPGGWMIRIGKREGLAALYNAVFGEHPSLDWYGFIADDVVPETPEWDRTLIEASFPDQMAVPIGGETTGGCPHFVLGGDLVRLVGWLALPGLDRIYIDTVWRDIAMSREALRELPNVSLKHHHFSNGLALFDSTYRKHRKAEDRALYEEWRQSWFSSLKAKETT